VERRELRIASETRNLSLVRQATAEVLGRSAFERADRDKIILAVDEAVANVVEHAYRGAPGEIEIDLALDERRLIVTIRDNGPPFDPRGVPAPDLREHVKQGLKGGFGLVEPEE